MTEATGTVRPSRRVAELRERMCVRELTMVPVTTPDGRLVGVLRLEDTRVGCALSGYPHRMKTIVLAYDDSEQAQRALEHAADLTEAFAAILVVVSVSPQPYAPAAVPVLEPDLAYTPSPVGGAMPTGDVLPAPPTAEPRAEPRELAQRRLEAARMTLTRRKIDAEYVAEVGTLAERVLEIAQERDADLIVVGSREHGLLERLLHRPLEQTVAKHAGCDVLLVH